MRGVRAHSLHLTGRVECGGAAHVSGRVREVRARTVYAGARAAREELDSALRPHSARAQGLLAPPGPAVGRGGLARASHALLRLHSHAHVQSAARACGGLARRAGALFRAVLRRQFVRGLRAARVQAKASVDCKAVHRRAQDRVQAGVQADRDDDHQLLRAYTQEQRGFAARRS